MIAEKKEIIEKVTECINNFNLENVDADTLNLLKEKIIKSVDEAIISSLDKSPFYNPLLDKSFNTSEIIESRKAKHLKRLNAHIAAQEGDKKSAVSFLIDEIVNELKYFENKSRSSYINNLSLKIRKYSMLYSDYEQVKELLKLGLTCQNEDIRKSTKITIKDLSQKKEEFKDLIS